MSTPNHFEKIARERQPVLRQELENVLGGADSPTSPKLHRMLTYQMGWWGEESGPRAQGKQIRPLLLLTTVSACGGDWRGALPAAAAVELIHNFSLIHDDIQDQSALRRGRPTIWKKWGTAQAINTGDAMFTLGFSALERLAETLTVQVARQSAAILQKTCLRLTQGQHLDIAFETQPEISLVEYRAMVEGKTASLLSACTELGALCGGASPACQTHYREYGRYLGLAFQAQDDLLGIWGKTEISGKSTTGDLAAGKKTLPILYGLSVGGRFTELWRKGRLTDEEIPAAARLLEEEGAYDYTKQRAEEWTRNALESLHQAQPRGESATTLQELTRKLLGRTA